MKQPIKVININNIEEMNHHLQEAKRLSNDILFRLPEEGEALNFDAFIDDSDYRIRLIYTKYNGKKNSCCMYVFDKDGNRLSNTQPAQAAAYMSKAYKIENVRDVLGLDASEVLGVKPLLEKNNNYDGKAVKAYEYDLSQAYAQMLKEPLPNTKTMQRNTELKAGQIGFITMGGYSVLILKAGVFCEYVFDAMPSPYCDWVDKVLKRIEKENDPFKKNDLKNIYRFAIGCLTHTNPFWRNTIIGRCNNEVIRLMKYNNWVYCNTDSIITTEPIKDINQSAYSWKLKRAGDVFKWARGKLAYQWGDELPKYKGPLQRYIKYYNETHAEKWDILKDPLPSDIQHKYNLNKDTLIIEVNNNYGL